MEVLAFLAAIAAIVCAAIGICRYAFGDLIKGLRRLRRLAEGRRTEGTEMSRLVAPLGLMAGGLANLLTALAVVTAIAIIAGIIAALNGLFGC